MIKLPHSQQSVVIGFYCLTAAPAHNRELAKIYLTIEAVDHIREIKRSGMYKGRDSSQ
jgi:hypothetical protein